MKAPIEIYKKEEKGDDSGNSQPTDLCNELVLIPGLPNHLTELCLSTLNPFLLYSVCHSWRRLIYSPSFPPFFSLYALLSPASSIGCSSNSVEFFSFDPISSMWNSLPSPPSNRPLRLLHRHPSFISRTLPIQSLTVSGRYLLLLAATTDDFLPALQCPLGFDPLTKKWFFGPPLLSPRRWCIIGSTDGAVYVVSGVGSGYQSHVARSAEKWNMRNKEIEWNWEKMAALKDGRFSREAIEAVGYKGKLCMVNVKGNTIKDGAVYNIITNQWEQMPAGMLAGWNGPAAVDDDEVIYMVDEANGALSRYDPDSDQWVEVIKSPEHLKGAEQIAAGRGRVCAVCGGGATRIAIVDVANKPARVWVVNPPPDTEVVAVHILPRMSHSDD